ncbi:hypothetical protein Pyrfu_0144 [Pyrolobus fumarii 1A]|uniref:Uncharacterized protein n=1 Tax=Pyrolobus fumarii (strain DSM 11204 / 1A) TaxID=694429 RepID=G0EEH5_PYRF1|nr:hypothetical protein [Pyrolobus fumarii]AEM38016.1 hypothetical protein Pyrfu_0144 [Pyrolobus fumarii 1A]
MSRIEEFAGLLRKRGYQVESSDSVVIARHPSAPISLEVRLEKDTLYLRLKYSDIRDYIDDLREAESDESAKEFIEEVLDDLSEAANQLEVLARQKGIRVQSTVKRDVLDILEALEDILES